MSQTSLPESGVLVSSKGSSLDTQAFAPSGSDGAVDEVRAGRIVVVVDEDEQAGALVMAAGHVTPEAVNFMASQARGPLRVSLPPERLEALRLPVERYAPDGSALAAPVALRSSGGSPVLSGANASACSAAVLALCDPRTKPTDLIRPGPVYPVGTRSGATRRAGHLEAGLDLALAADLLPAALVCGILNEGGEVADPPAITRLAARHGLKVVSVEQAARLRLRHEVEVRLPTKFGEFRAKIYVDVRNGQTHLALVAGEPEGKESVVAYIHRRCPLGDLLHSLSCDCGARLEGAMARVREVGEGVVVYTRAEPSRGRSRDEVSCQKARLTPPPDGKDEAPEEDDRAVGALIFENLGMRRVHLITGKEAG